MPFICTDQNRYLGEHDCRRYHYGDMTLIRDCCVADALARRELADRVAMTRWHPAFQLFAAARGSLTDAELALVPDLKL
jgi:hypothetical protein